MSQFQTPEPHDPAESPTTPLPRDTTARDQVAPSPSDTETLTEETSHDRGGASVGAEAPPAEPQVWSATTVAEHPPVTARRTRVSTLVLGLILTLLGVGAVLTGLGYTLDLQLSLAALLSITALALLVNAATRRGTS